MAQQYEVTEFVGIDISKSTFDIHGDEIGKEELSNEQKGFKHLLNRLEKDSCCVMEATGAYHHRLAQFLYDNDKMVSVLNPLIVKRYGQMKLRLNKNDKADAQLIADYANDHGVTLWEPLPVYIEECRSMQASISIYLKQSTQLKNRIELLTSRGETTGLVVRSVKRQLRSLKKEIENLESEMKQILKQHDQELLTCLMSIPGIGPKSAMFLIVHTNGMRDFQTAKQVISFLGLAPMERTSGSSIRGVSRISHRGNPKLRSMMFLCSFTAHKHNPQCKALFDRIVAKGKSPKLALIAVANKLLKQAFAISRSRIPYDAAYRSIKPC
jgi:transposase